jgi:hypothetical protein
VYELNELETALEGKRGGRAYKVADLLPVRVIAIDEARGRVDLTLAGDPDGDDDMGRGRSGAAAAGSRGRDDGVRAGGAGGAGSGGRDKSRSGPHSGSRKKGSPRTRSSKTTRPPQGRGRR